MLQNHELAFQAKSDLVLMSYIEQNSERGLLFVIVLSWPYQQNRLLLLCHTSNKMAKEVYSLLIFSCQFCCKRGLLFVIDLSTVLYPKSVNVLVPLMELATLKELWPLHPKSLNVLVPLVELATLKDINRHHYQTVSCCLL